jgi:hypothetical protein
MTYAITERYEDGTGTTVGWDYKTVEEAIEAAKDFYRYENRRFKYEVSEGFAKVIWSTDEIAPWEDI